MCKTEKPDPNATKHSSKKRKLPTSKLGSMRVSWWNPFSFPISFWWRNTCWTMQTSSFTSCHNDSCDLEISPSWDTKSEHKGSNDRGPVSIGHLLRTHFNFFCDWRTQVKSLHWLCLFNFSVVRNRINSFYKRWTSYFVFTCRILLWSSKNNSDHVTKKFRDLNMRKGFKRAIS